MNDFARNLLVHIKYPYTAGIIAMAWIGVAIILTLNNGAYLEVLVVLTAIVSLMIAAIGFSSPKK